MKKQLLAIVIAVAFMAMFTPVIAADNTDKDEPKAGFGVTAGWHGYDIDKIEYKHNTHPDDAFLPNSWIPGSAGKTSIEGMTHFLAIGPRYQDRLAKNLMCNFDIGILVGGQQNSMQNANDYRDPAHGAFVYSKSRFGLYAGFGVTYHIKRFYFGAQGEIAGLLVSHGWNRFATDQAESHELVFLPSVGPKVGYRFTDVFGLEGGYQFGSKGNVFNVSAVLSF